MKKIRNKVLMKDKLMISSREKEKKRRSLRCSRCGRIMIFGMMMNGLCEKCADRLLTEASELLKKSVDFKGKL